LVLTPHSDRDMDLVKGAVDTFQVAGHSEERERRFFFVEFFLKNDVGIPRMRDLRLPIELFGIPYTPQSESFY